MGFELIRHWVALSALFLSLVVVGYLEHRSNSASADRRIGMIDPKQVALSDSPIRPDWILQGPAKATSRLIGNTHDGLAQLLVWRVSAGRFNWYYDFDESVTILDGEVFLTDGANAASGNPTERRLGPGDVVFFHVGSVATWRVPDHVRKIATIKYPLPSPVASVARLYKQVRSWILPETAVAGL